MSTVKLRTGKEASEPMVKVLSLSLETLMTKNPIGFYELVTKCQDASHKFFGNTESVLQELSLVEPNGSVNDLVQDIVLASVEGEGLEMRLVNPIGVLTTNETSVERISMVPADLMDHDLFKTIHRAADIVFEYVDRKYTTGSSRPSMHDARTSEANPYYHQTSSGLFLECYYRMPNRLWTPWGEWCFGGSGSSMGNQFDEVVDKLRTRFGLVLYKPERNETMGTIGPIYAMTCVDNQPLPTAMELARDKYNSYDNVKSAWANLVTLHRS